MYALRAREGLPPLLKSASCCRKGPQVLSRHGVSVSLARWSRRQESNFRCAPQGWRSGQSGESTSPSQSATAWVAALAACLTVASDQTERTGLCEQQQKIVWVDAYGKKVAVHEKGIDSFKGKSAPEAAHCSRYYPYVILGYGVAGRAALDALLRRHPGANVLVVDARPDMPSPLSNAVDEVSSGSAGDRSRRRRGDTHAAQKGRTALPQDDAAANVEFARGSRATALDADRGVVTLSEASLQESREGAAVAEEIAFGRCLLALGSRSRPPPPGFIDPAAWEDVALLGSREGVAREGLRREIAAGRGVTIVGSSWQALELACWLQEGRSAMPSSLAASDVTGVVNPGTCRMVFPDYAPLDHILPRYLSVALMRRLNKKRIKTVGHSSLRWVGRATYPVYPSSSPPPTPEPQPVSSPEGEVSAIATAAADAENSVLNEQLSPSVDSSREQAEPPQEQEQRASEMEAAATKPLRSEAAPSVERKPPRRRLQVMTAHSFDHLDTAIHSTDRVVLAGVDVAPLELSVDLHAKSDANARNESGSGGGNASSTIARRKNPVTVEVDTRRGAVVVNAELAASSRVWAAGDAACYPSQTQRGRRLVVRSADHAHHSGMVAGENMAASEAAAVATAAGTRTTEGGGGRRYCHSPAFVGEAPLAGVRVAMVGDCDAAMSTHGFWWTNNATGLTRKNTTFSPSDVAIKSARRNSISSTQAAETDATTGEAAVTLRARQTVRRDFTPVFGTGVLFYTHGAEVKGVMLWGFPGEAATSAAVTGFRRRSSTDEGGDGNVSDLMAADAAAGISARALDLARHIMERSANMDVDLSDDRVLQAWVQGLSDAARAVVQETGLGHMQPMRRSVPGRVTSSTRRPPGTRDELMYQNTSKTSSAQRRLRAAYAARIRGEEPPPFPSFAGGYDSEEFDPEMMEFTGYDSGTADGDGGSGDAKKGSQ